MVDLFTVHRKGQNYLTLGKSICRKVVRSAMNISFSSGTSRTSLVTTLRKPRHSVLGFTLVEMLVVVTIIGILASLITAAAVAARRRAKIAAIVTEISQLDAACKAYKERFGEYPPDFAPEEVLGGSGCIYYSSVLRHLSKAFPRFVLSGSTDAARWTSLQGIVKSNWKIDIGSYSTATTGCGSSPAMALTFCLGGKPVWVDVSNQSLGVKGFKGFSANPINPFDDSANRIGPFYDFKPEQVAYIPTYNNGNSMLCCWPIGACGNRTSSPIMYFRATNGGYCRENGTTIRQCWSTTPCNVHPAIDTRIGTTAWANPQSFQIYCAGLDVTYGNLGTGQTTVLQYPAGTNYQPETFDDITNFSNGTLEDSIP